MGICCVCCRVVRVIKAFLSRSKLGLALHPDHTLEFHFFLPMINYVELSNIDYLKKYFKDIVHPKTTASFNKSGATQLLREVAKVFPTPGNPNKELPKTEKEFRNIWNNLGSAVHMLWKALKEFAIQRDLQSREPARLSKDERAERDKVRWSMLYVPLCMLCTCCVG